MKNPWPYSIAAFFAIAITGVAAFIAFAMRQDMDLVRPDYYEQEIRFQEQMERVARTRELGGLKIDYDASLETLNVRLPFSHANSVARVRLYRPSNAALDRSHHFQVSIDGCASVAVPDLVAGIWRAQLSWVAHGKDYYLEQQFIVP